MRHYLYQGRNSLIIKQATTILSWIIAACAVFRCREESFFSPDHLVYDTDIGLYDSYDLAGDVVGVVGYGDAAVSVGGHPDGELDGLQQPFGINVNRNHECTENGKENAQKTVTTVHKNQ